MGPHKNKLPVEVRFWRHVEKLESGCWIWHGATTQLGYGRLFLNRGHPVYPHRYYYELVNGPIPKGLVIDHLCRNPGCVNPSHLEAVAQSENILRGVQPLKNRNKTHCPQGHEYSPENTYRSNGMRFCKTCSKMRNKAFYKNREQLNSPKN